MLECLQWRQWRDRRRQHVPNFCCGNGEGTITDDLDGIVLSIVRYSKHLWRWCFCICFCVFLETKAWEAASRPWSRRPCDDRPEQTHHVWGRWQGWGDCQTEGRDGCLDGETSKQDWRGRWLLIFLNIIDSALNLAKDLAATWVVRQMECEKFFT